jgi:hypothetical protein
MLPTLRLRYDTWLCHGIAMEKSLLRQRWFRLGLIVAGLAAVTSTQWIPKLTAAASSRPTFSAVGSDTFSRQRVLGGEFVEPETKKLRRGLWLENFDGSKRRLLVDHGDALSVLYPTFTGDGDSVIFTAAHPGSYEVHRYHMRTFFLETVQSSVRPFDEQTVASIAKDVPLTNDVTASVVGPSNLVDFAVPDPSQVMS